MPNFLQLPPAIRSRLEENPDVDPRSLDSKDLFLHACHAGGLPYVELSPSMIDMAGYRKLGARICDKHRVLPLFSHETLAVFATGQPWNSKLLTNLRQDLHMEVILVGVFQDSLDQVSGQVKLLVETLPPDKEEEIELTHVTESGWELGVVEGAQETDLAKNIVRKAYQMGASDIHIEPFEDQLDIRFRIHGDMVVMPPVEKSYAQKIINDFKLLSQMKLSDYNTLKDGRMSVRVSNVRSLDLRVAAAPTEFGEAMVMRLLDPEAIRRDLGRLPFEGRALEVVKFALTRPTGLFIMTGPTGSGKTTTLYKCLNSLDSSQMKIITIEDPVEYKFKGLTQIQIDPESNVTFAAALRSVVRMDPDVIMVGEIRDPETAGLAIQAALTGHLVLTTLHTNDAVGIVPRLLDLGVSNQLIRSTLQLVIAQRLLGKLCNECKEREDPDVLVLRHFERHRVQPPKVIYNQNLSGCEACNYTGISGRVPIFEFMQASREIVRAIGSGAPEHELRNICDQEGNYPLIRHGLQLAAAGVVSYREAEVWETSMS